MKERARWSACTVFIMLAIFMAMVAAFTGLTLLHGSMDSELTNENMVKSLEQLDEEGVYPNIGEVIGHKKLTGLAGQGSRIDNFTNMWMIQGADSDHYFDSEEYDKAKPYNPDNRKALEGGVAARVFASGWDHGCYWSGYRLFMKPMLVFMDVNGIRLVQLLVVIVSLCWATVRVGKDVGVAEAAFLLVAVLLINPCNVLLDFDQAPDFVQALLAVVTVLWMLRRRASGRWFIAFFMAMGMVEAFINCLIMPLITLGLPLVAYLLRQGKRGAPAKAMAVDAFKFCIAWCFGYAGSFFAVWVMTALFTGESVPGSITVGLGHFFRRSGANEASLATSVGLSIQNNVNLNVPIVWALVVAALGVSVSACAKDDTGKRDTVLGLVPLAVFSLLPFAWIIVMNNHSYIHSWMVHDIFAFTIWGLACFVYYLACEHSGSRKDECV